MKGGNVHINLNKKFFFHSKHVEPHIRQKSMQIYTILIVTFEPSMCQVLNELEIWMNHFLKYKINLILWGCVVD